MRVSRLFKVSEANESRIPQCGILLYLLRHWKCLPFCNKFFGLKLIAQQADFIAHCAISLSQYIIEYKSLRFYLNLPFYTFQTDNLFRHIFGSLARGVDFYRV